MKKITFLVLSVDITGGVERVVSTIVNDLAKTYEISILSFYGNHDPFFPLDNNINVEYLYNQKYKMSHAIFNTTLKIRQFLVRNKIEKLIVVDIGLIPQAIFATLGLGIKTIFWNHGNYIPYGVNKIPCRVKLARWMAKKFCSNIVTLTERDKQEWDKKKYRANVNVILNPSNYSIYDGEPEHNNRIILALGRMTFQKGFDLLLDAWKNVKEKKGWKLYIVGDGEDKTRLLEMVNHFGLQDTVCFFPFSENVSEFYRKASFYCLSSRFEGLPLVLIEAISFGLPIISFDCYTGPSEIIKNSGILCEPENSNSLAESIINFISMEESKYKSYVAGAKLDADRFKLENIIQKWKDIIEEK